MTNGTVCIPLKRRDAPKLKLYCFHHAGGNASSFSSWVDRLPGSIEIWAVQLPNRFSKSAHPMLTIDSLLPDLIAAFESSRLQDDRLIPFAFYGHSLGALVAFELMHSLSGVRENKPIMLAISGHRAPDRRLRQALMHELEDAAFIEQLRTLGGVPDGLFDNQALTPFLLPMLRSDLHLSETYSHVPRSPLAVPIIGFRGESDPILTQEDFDSWTGHTDSTCILHTLSGGHFFDRTSQRLLKEILAAELLRAVPGTTIP